jgi:hypothetical protein
MHKVNFMLEDDIREELLKMIPPRRRSRLVNDAIRKELLRIKRKEATDKLIALRKETATLSSKAIIRELRKARARA